MVARGRMRLRRQKTKHIGHVGFSRGLHPCKGRQRGTCFNPSKAIKEKKYDMSSLYYPVKGMVSRDFYVRFNSLLSSPWSTDTSLSATSMLCRLTFWWSVHWGNYLHYQTHTVTFPLPASHTSPASLI